MSRTIDIAFERELEDMFYTLTQQKVSKFESKVSMVPNVKGKSHDVNRLGNQEAYDVNSANADTVILDLPHSRRRMNMQPKAWAAMIDTFDEVMLLTTPTSEYTQQCVAAINRAVDRHIITQMLGNAISVSAADAESNVALTLTIANGGTSMTLDKIRTAMYNFDVNEVDEADRYLAISPYAKLSLLKFAEIGSRDYNPSVGAFITGQVPTLFGFQTFVSTLLPVASSIRDCIAFARQGTKVGKGSIQEISIDKIPTKNNNWQVLGKVVIGTVRIDENLVQKIGVDETA